MEKAARAAPQALTILHMDDDPAMREITSLLLGHQGHRVLSCCNVDETVAAYREHLARRASTDGGVQRPRGVNGNVSAASRSRAADARPASPP